MKHARFTLVVMALVFFFAQGQAALGQAKDPATLLKQYASKSAKAPLGDYVPCLFNDDENFALRAQESSAPPAVLDSDAAAAFVKLEQQDIQAQFLIKDPNNAESLTPTQQAAQAFGSSLKPADVEGRSLGDAIAGLGTAAAAFNSQKSTAVPIQASDVVKLQSTSRAQTGLGGIERPDDVSCSFSIMTWQETNEFFGRMVANDYVAIEVNLRNMNGQNEFLVHDIQVAVDTGLDKTQFGRFEAGRDKMIVRGVAQRGVSDDVRNRIMNTLSTMGSVAGGASGALTASISATSSHWPTYISEAVSIFEGPLLDGLGKIFPDHTVTNVNNVSDMAFSASSTMKTVVPIQGSVPLVTFIASRPLGQLPFARCGQLKGRGFEPDWMKTEPNDARRNPTSDMCNLDTVKRVSDGTAQYYHRSVDYKNWAPAALEILKRRVFVVVAGVHIQEVAPNAKAENIVCPQASDGTVDLSKQDKSGDVSCTISGTNLGSAKSAKLEQGTATSVSATITPAADGNSAVLSFKASALAGDSGTFEVFSVDSAGKETDLDRSLQFALHAVVSSVVYSQTKLDATADLTVTLKGSELDQLADISLIDKGAKVLIAGRITDPAPPALVQATTPSITVTFAKADLAKFTDKTNGPVTLQYNSPGDATTKATLAADKGLPLQ